MKRFENEKLIAGLFVRSAFKDRTVLYLAVVLLGLLTYAAFSGWRTLEQQRMIRFKFQEEARKDWMSNPDKHPHRMAHYGDYAFRPKPPLSVFDFGMESYFGNAIYLEAHKQNSTNFSEAGFSTGFLRFGEISMAMVLQLLLPLIIFFIGFGAIATEKENGTLKIILSQGLSWNELIIGKSLGLFLIVMIFYVPAILALAGIWLSVRTPGIWTDEFWRLLLIAIVYFFYLLTFSVLAVIVSAVSRTAKTSLITLMGIWLLLTIILPRTCQSLGSYLYRAPSKAAFEAAIEADILKQGDSHNPDDLHYKALKDSLLTVYKVDSVQKLPFNYSGYVMAEGEKISSEIYNQHFESLLDVYRSQNSFYKLVSLFNPFMAVKSLSMALSGTDFNSYVDFQKQAETHRYDLAQKMNDLQIRYISNQKPKPGDPPLSIDRKHWAEVTAFVYTPVLVSSVFSNEILPFFSFILWIIFLLFALRTLSKKLKAI